MRALNCMLFDSMPNHGIEKLSIIYDSALWPVGDTREFPHEATLKAAAAKMSGLVCIDIEHWKLRGVTPYERSVNIQKYVDTIKIIKTQSPYIKIGLYLMLPQRDYWTPVGGNATSIANWEQENNTLAPIANVVDVIFPSLYTFYNDPLNWAKYAKANIAEAKKYGKPVYPFIWPQYHNSNAALSGQLIDGPFWALQLQTCKENADGVAIWGGYKVPWDENAPWWTETKLFLGPKA